MCPSRSLLYTSPLGASSVAKCFSNRLLLLHLVASVNVSLELQVDCSTQLTLICRHSDALTPPLWIHNGTVESGEVLGTAFPGANYTVLTRTEHTATITGVDNVQALDEYLIQCVYMKIWATSSRAMLSSSPSSLQVSVCAVYKTLSFFMMYSHEQCMPMHQQLVVYSHALLTELALTDLSFY